MRFVKLTEKERADLNTMYKTSSNHVTRERCHCLLLSDRRHSMSEISRLLEINRLKIVRLIDAWESAGEKYSVLSIAKGRGAKIKLEQVKDRLPDLLKEHCHNLTPILDKLENEYNIKICKQTLQNFLKVNGL